MVSRGIFTLLILLTVLLSGCGNTERAEYIPMTPAERICVQQQQAYLLKSTPSTLSGHDQDWDDAVSAANRAARAACCELRLIEYSVFTQAPTGKWGSAYRVVEE
jgi:hypothetical protein